MKVLLVTKPLGAPWDDSAKLIPRALAERAAGAVAFHLLTARDDVTQWPGNARTHAVAPAGGYKTAWRTRWSLIQSVLRLGPKADLVHFFFQPHLLASRLARWLTRRIRRPSVHTVLSAPHPGSERGLLFADRTVTLSRATADAFARAGERAPDVIRPALPEESPVTAERADAARRAAGLVDRFVLFPGDYEFTGGHELLLQVWRRDKSLPRLVLTGRDKTRAAATRRARLHVMSSEFGLEERVRFLGRVPDLGGLQAAADALLFPAESLYAKTDLPLVVLEAWRDGVPVLVSDLPPLREAVQGGGAVLPPSAEEWGRAVHSLESRGDAWRSAGRAHWREWYSAERAAASYVDLYHALRDGGRADAGGESRAL